MKKKLLGLLLALSLLLGLSACGGNGLSVGIIGGNDGPTDLIISDGSAYDGADYTDTTDPDGFSPDETLGEYDYRIDEAGWYYSAEDVSEYLWTYGELPDNYITKEEARDLGWSGGSVEDYAGKGYAIGGDRFGNREGLLPEAEDRLYYECDLNTAGEDSRGAERLVFSNDGLIYYTADHYESFELLYAP